MPAHASGLRRRAEISLNAIRSNARLLTEHRAEGTASDPLLADLRGDAYGHGLRAVAEALRDIGVDGFLVSDPVARDTIAAEHAGSLILVARTDRIGTAPGTDAWAADAEYSILGPALYGLATTPAGLRPALRLTAEAVSVKRVAEGRGVSYGYTYRTSGEATLVLAGLGYADGIPRVASNRAPVLVGSTRARVTGRIAMDQFVVDVGDALPQAGDDVVLFGDAERGEPTAIQWAAATGLRAEVIACGLGPRIERVYAQ
jgi:alanine racemase